MTRKPDACPANRPVIRLVTVGSPELQPWESALGSTAFARPPPPALATNLLAWTQTLAWAEHELV
jgi:hypothetical protein